MKNRKVLSSSTLLFVLAIVSCELDIPVREMTDAKLTIDRAEEVKAAKYDRKNLYYAFQELYNSHDFIKQDKADDAKKSAIKSKNFALASIKTSLPLLSADTIAEAKKIYSEAEELYGGASSGEEMKIADGKIKQAEKLNSDKKFWDAYLEAKGAIAAAASARDKALAIIPERIKSLHEEMKILKSNRGNDFASDEISRTDLLLGESKELFAGKKSREALGKLNQGEALLKSAKEKTEKGLAKEKIISVTRLYDDTKKRDTDNKFSAELKEVSAILMSSNQMFEKGSYVESMNKAEEAELILKTTSSEIEKYIASVGAGNEKGKDKNVTGGEGDKVTYTVKRRKKNTDTLWRISLIVYKNAKLWPYIYSANRSQIKDPDLIFPGQKFVIPSIEKIRKIKKKR
jgi:LysM repeat protein